MKFDNAVEMFNYVTRQERDLYCKEKGLYVFIYNNLGSIAVYYIDESEAEELRKQSAEHHEYWGSFLGVGGEIYDDPSYDDFDPNQMSNIDWFEQNYTGEWEDVTGGLGLNTIN